MKRKVFMVDEKTHRALAILAARKGTTMQGEATEGILSHVARENKKLKVAA